MKFPILRCRAFTILELLVSIGILSILITLAWAGWMDLLPAFRLDAAAGELVSDMQAARMKAMSENCVYSIGFDVLTPGYQVFRETETERVAVKTVRFPETYPGIRYGMDGVEPIHGNGEVFPVRFFSGKPRAVFYPTGMGDTGTVYLMPAGDHPPPLRRRAVTVAVTGRIKTWKYSGSAWK